MNPLRGLFCLVTIAGAGAISSCTNAKLYSQDYEPDFASLTGVEGDLCTDDPASVGFPLKIAVIVDGGVAGALDNRVAELNALVARYSSSDVAFDFVLMGQTGQSLTQGFTGDPSVIASAVQSIGQNVSPLRNYEAAMLTATTDIESDALGTSPGLRSRTHYAMIFVAQGAPTPSLPTLWCGANQLTPGSTQCTAQFAANFCPNQTPAPADCELVLYQALVSQLSSFLRTNGALDFIGHFYQIGADTRADALLTAMAQAAKGSFAQFAPGMLNLLDTALIDPSSPFLLRDFVVWNANALLRGGVPTADSDGDGLSDAEEESIGTTPTSSDSDGDGVGDKIEYALEYPGSQFNPLLAGTFTECASLTPPFPDSDGDGLNDCEEAVEGTSASLQDTDRDGLPDVLEVLRGVYPLVDDRLYDTDGDGVKNGAELERGTDPKTNDSAAAVLYGYSDNAVSSGSEGGVVVVLNASPEYPYPGVTVETVSGTTGGTATLEVSSGPPLTMALTDIGSNAPGLPVDVSASGLFTLQSPSLQEMVVRVDSSVLGLAVPASAGVPITLTPSVRACFHVNVQNISLVSTKPIPGDGGATARTGPGWNLVNVYMGQSLDGDLAAPTVYRADTVPFQFVPPNLKTPSSAFVTLQQNDLVTVVTN